MTLVDSVAKSNKGGCKKDAFVTGSKYAEVVALHAVAGGVISVLNGSKFGYGFVSAGFTKSLGHSIAQIGDNEVLVSLTTIIVGGTASRLSGGKFANGATTAAFQVALNFFGGVEEEPQFDESKLKEMSFRLNVELSKLADQDLGLIENKVRLAAILRLLNPNISIKDAWKVAQSKVLLHTSLTVKVSSMTMKRSGEIIFHRLLGGFDDVGVAEAGISGLGDSRVAMAGMIGNVLKIASLTTLGGDIYPVDVNVALDKYFIESQNTFAIYLINSN